MSNITGPRLQPASGNDPKSLVILLHGYGADGNDLIDLGQHWAELLPDTMFVSPHAPQPCGMAPMGREWFPLSPNPGGLRDPEELLSGVRHAEQSLQEFIDIELKAHELTEENCALVGFSQGTMMSLHVGLRREKQLAGIVGFSGALAGPSVLAEEIKSQPNCVLVHGEADEVVPIEALANAETALKQVDVPVKTLSVPGLGHGIDGSGFQLGGLFLAQVLGAPTGETAS